MRIGVVLLISMAAAAAATLPVKRVVVYKNGVALIERAGDVAAGESVRLEFKATEMDDVLKSLVIEAAGGKISGVRYEPNEPLRVRDQQPLALLLDQLRGERVELRLGSQTVSGTIVSGRLAPLPNQGQRQELLLLVGGEFQTIDLERASAVKLADPKLELNLNRAQGANRRGLWIDTTGVTRLAARYLTPAPVWKSSYRLVLPETGEATLEGWAIVDNASEEDWRNVELTVVSGKPVSFVSNLYAPRWVERPRVELAESKAVQPQVFGGAVARDEAMAKSGLGAPRAMRMAAAPAPPPAPMLMESAVAVETETREAGDLFEYRFAGRVNARKGESVMVPFVQQKIAARQLLIYADRSSPNPRSAAELTNSTGKTLDGGPITVYAAGAYGGEALVETFKTGDKRLISYAVDFGTRVSVETGSGPGVVRTLKASRGVLETRTAFRVTTVYAVKNTDAKEKAVLIEHPVQPGMTLVSPKPEERTEKDYRFLVRAAAAGAGKLEVVEERLLDDSVQIGGLSLDQIAVYSNTRGIPAAARSQLEALAAKRREMADREREIRAAEQESAEIAKDQDRVRQNLGSLNRVSGQQEMVQKYAAEMAQQDVALAKLRDRIAGLRRQLQAAQREWSALVEKAGF